MFKTDKLTKIRTFVLIRISKKKDLNDEKKTPKMNFRLFTSCSYRLKKAILHLFVNTKSREYNPEPCGMPQGWTILLETIFDHKKQSNLSCLLVINNVSDSLVM